ncbi:MAG: tyrosine-type recombinase/integrase [bacterium]|nr:tyrosine-type recombinase/integrase [bacterium]
MRGHIRKKEWTTKKGEERHSYEVIVYVGRNPTTGAPRLRSKTAKTKREAERLLRDWLNQLETGGITAPSRMRLEELLLTHYLEGFARRNLRPTTLDSYERTIKLHILPVLGHVPVQKLTPGQINVFYAGLLEKGVSPRVTRYCHAVLHRTLALAVKWRIAAYNPAAQADPPKVPRKEMQALGAEGIRALLEAAHQDRLYPLWMLAVSTGMRRGEICGLRWEDVDLDLGTVMVRRTLVMVAGRPTPQEPKTARSRRRVKLPDSSVEALRQWRIEQKKERLVHGEGYVDSGNVFTQRDGKPLRPDLLSKRYFPRLLKAAALPPTLRFHDLRHSHATALLQAGTPAKVISDRLGHFSTGFTMDTYAHVTPSLEQEAADRFDALVFGGDEATKKQQG